MFLMYICIFLKNTQNCRISILKYIYVYFFVYFFVYFCRELQRIRLQDSKQPEQYFGKYMIYAQLGLPVFVEPRSTQLEIFESRSALKTCRLYQIVKKGVDEDIFNGWNASYSQQQLDIIVRNKLFLDVTQFTSNGQTLERVIRKLLNNDQTRFTDAACAVLANEETDYLLNLSYLSIICKFLAINGSTGNEYSEHTQLNQYISQGLSAQHRAKKFGGTYGLIVAEAVKQIHSGYDSTWLSTLTSLGIDADDEMSEFNSDSDIEMNDNRYITLFLWLFWYIFLTIFATIFYIL